jgi:hypothetical protein
MREERGSALSILPDAKALRQRYGGDFIGHLVTLCRLAVNEARAARKDMLEDTSLVRSDDRSRLGEARDVLLSLTMVATSIETFRDDSLIDRLEATLKREQEEGKKYMVGVIEVTPEFFLNLLETMRSLRGLQEFMSASLTRLGAANRQVEAILDADDDELQEVVRWQDTSEVLNSIWPEAFLGG